MSTDSSEEHPYATGKSLRVFGKIRDRPDDFVVDELPAYEPLGHGDHLFVRFQKTGLNTQEAVRLIAAALGVDAGQAGYAGMKDRHAVTQQWASFFGAEPERALALELPAIRVLAAARHPHKIRTGHLRANHFKLLIRDAPAEQLETATQVFAELDRRGAPNYYGEQRFGRDRGNVAEARRFVLEDGPPPRDRFRRKLLASALQSEVFNHWLAGRLRAGTFDQPMLGDLMRKEDSGGMFVASEIEPARERMAGWEISPTGPMFGAKMRWPEGEARALEEQLCADFGFTEERMSRMRGLLPGTRRVARVRPEDVSIAAVPAGIELAFTLPKGAYATVILRELLKSSPN
jgi:tRNA pseudouridine13 synthase